jgi:hypothetical protein
MNNPGSVVPLSDLVSIAAAVFHFGIHGAFPRPVQEEYCALPVGAPDFQSGERGFSSLANMSSADQLRFSAGLRGAAAKANLKERFSAGLEVSAPPTRKSGAPTASTPKGSDTT